MKKILKLIIRIIVAMIFLCLVAVLGLNLAFKLNYGAFYAEANREFAIPGLHDGFIPQGFARCEDGTFLTCGYMKDGRASRIYVIGTDSYVTMQDAKGAADTNHAGGLAVYGQYLYVTNEENLNVYLLKDVLSASPGAAVTPMGLVYTGVRSAFIEVCGDKLYLGEFYRAENYPTDVSHHMTTDSGEEHHALMAVYGLSPSAKFGFDAAVPQCVYSIGDLAQGICVTDKGSLCLSTSYGTASSHIMIYEDPAQSPADGKFDLGGAQVPLYYLDAKHLEKTITLFPMTEELVFTGGRLYILGESASNKYIFGKLTGCERVYSLPVS